MYIEFEKLDTKELAMSEFLNQKMDLCSHLGRAGTAIDERFSELEDKIAKLELTIRMMQPNEPKAVRLPNRYRDDADLGRATDSAFLELLYLKICKVASIAHSGLRQDAVNEVREAIDSHIAGKPQKWTVR